MMVGILLLQRANAAVGQLDCFGVRFVFGRVMSDDRLRWGISVAPRRFFSYIVARSIETRDSEHN